MKKNYDPDNYANELIKDFVVHYNIKEVWISAKKENEKETK